METVVPRALEHDDARVLEDRRQLADAVRVMVVVPEHGVHGQVETRARGRDDAHLLRLSVRGQVAGEQDEIGCVRDVRERLVDAGRDAFFGVHIARRCDPD